MSAEPASARRQGTSIASARLSVRVITNLPEEGRHTRRRECGNLSDEGSGKADKQSLQVEHGDRREYEDDLVGPSGC